MRRIVGGLLCGLMISSLVGCADYFTDLKQIEKPTSPPSEVFSQISTQSSAQPLEGLTSTIRLNESKSGWIGNSGTGFGNPDFYDLTGTSSGTSITVRMEATGNFDVGVWKDGNWAVWDTDRYTAPKTLHTTAGNTTKIWVNSWNSSGNYTVTVSGSMNNDRTSSSVRCSRYSNLGVVCDGDILFLQGGFFDYLIPGIWTHMAIVTDAPGGKTVEAFKKTASIPVGFGSVSLWNEWAVNPDFIVAVRYVPTYPESIRVNATRLAVNIAESGVAYSFTASRTSHTEYYCSSLVWQVYYEASDGVIDLDSNAVRNNNVTLNLTHVLPDEIYLSPWVILPVGR